MENCETIANRVQHVRLIPRSYLAIDINIHNTQMIRIVIGTRKRSDNNIIILWILKCTLLLVLLFYIIFGIRSLIFHVNLYANKNFVLFGSTECIGKSDVYPLRSFSILHILHTDKHQSFRKQWFSVLKYY